MVASRPGSCFVRHAVCLVLACLPVFVSGCKKPEEIRVYEVPHEELTELLYQRMLGAIIPNEKEAWFFKVQGEMDELGKFEPAFQSFTKSVEIKEGKVHWTAPETWQERAGGEFRFTTFVIPNGKSEPFELAISKLDAPEGVNDEFLQANLSRWRGQLGLDSITKAEVSKVTNKLTVKGGIAYTVNFIGLLGPKKPQGHPPVSQPPAGKSEPPSANQAATLPQEGPGDAGFEFTTPEGWKPGKVSSMRKASLAVGEGAAAADISVFEFPADANDLLSNVNRWRDQVGLKGVTSEELDKSVRKIDVGGIPGDYVELIGQQQAILGVMVKKGASAWFFKLQGPPELATRERARFEAFVKSARIR